MTIPQAVSPSTLTPGLYLVVDLLASAASPSTGELKTVIVAPKSSAGNLTPDTEVRSIGGVSDASAAFGPGTPGHLASKLLYARFPTATVDVIAPVAGAGVATLNVTFAGAPTSNTSILFDVMGREFEIAWLVGETPDDVKQKAIDAINQRTDDLFVTGVTGGVGILTINAKTPGRGGNDVKVLAVLSIAQTGSETVTGAAVYTNLAGGTTDPDYTNALSELEGEEYHFILPCLSNNDATNVATTSNVKRVVDHIDGLDSGLNARLQQVIAASFGTVAQAVAATVSSNNGQNATFGEHILCINGRGLPAELAALEAGGRLAAISIDPAANRIGEIMNEYIGAKDKIADNPTLGDSETALGGGVSLIGYTAQGLERLVRAVTTHSEDDVGAPDRRLLDTQNVDGTYIIARDLRSSLPQEFQGAKITPDVPAGQDPPPKGVIEERDIKAFIITRMRFWQAQGVATQKSVDDSIANGTLIVKVNDSDPTQVDIVVPFTIVPPLAKLGVTAQRIPA
jgi:phage tail sheath gpL-like